MDEGLSQFQWQAERRRKEFRGGDPVAGFGPDGTYTLWVPPAASGRRVVFEGGRARVLVDAGVAGNAELAELRNRVVASFAADGEGFLRVDIAFMDYAAAVLRQNYELTDADLAFALAGAADWQAAMARHALGGDDVVQALLSLAPDYVGRLVDAAEPRIPPPPPLDWAAHQPPPIAQPIPPASTRGPAWRRYLRHFGLAGK